MIRPWSIWQFPINHKITHALYESLIMLATMTTATVDMGVYLTNDPEPIFKYRHSYILLLRLLLRQFVHFLPVCMYARMYACVYVCIYVCMCV